MTMWGRIQPIAHDCQYIGKVSYARSTENFQKGMHYIRMYYRMDCGKKLGSLVMGTCYVFERPATTTLEERRPKDTLPRQLLP